MFIYVLRRRTLQVLILKFCVLAKDAIPSNLLIIVKYRHSSMQLPKHHGRRGNLPPGGKIWANDTQSI